MIAAEHHWMDERPDQVGRRQEGSWHAAVRSDSDAGGSLEVGVVVVVIVVEVEVLVPVPVLVIAPDRMLDPFMPLWDKDGWSTSGFATVAHVNEKSRSFEVEVPLSRRDVGISGWGRWIADADAYADVVIEELSDDKALMLMRCEGSCGNNTMREGIQTGTGLIALVAVAVCGSQSQQSQLFV
jgi:hypothetical protein